MREEQDNSVGSLDELLDETHGATSPHPFYLPVSQRADVSSSQAPVFSFGLGRPRHNWSLKERWQRALALGGVIDWRNSIASRDRRSTGTVSDRSKNHPRPPCASRSRGRVQADLSSAQEEDDQSDDEDSTEYAATDVHVDLH